jgi:hypothetical protein
MKEDETGGACSADAEITSECKNLVGNPEEKRTLGRLRSRWKIILKFILETYGWSVWNECIWLGIRTGVLLT